MSSNSGLSPVGVIGLGLLGSALAERLIRAGFPTYVHNRTREKAYTLEEMGGTWSNNPMEDCDRVVICLYDTGVVRAMLSSMQSGLHAGQILIDTTTGDPEETAELGRQLADQQIDYLESPIAASSEQTRKGQAMAVVSGSKRAYDECSDIFSAIASKSHFVGDWGNAAKMKLVNNLILGLNRAVLAEGLWFSNVIGLEAETTLNVVREGNAYSGVMDTKGMKMVRGDFAPQAKLNQHAKDVRIMIDQARRSGVRLPFTDLHLQLLERGDELGLGDLDNSAIIQSIEDAGQELAC